MREILFRIKVILTNEGKSFYNSQSEFIESVIHNVVSLDLINNQCVIYDENKESVINIFESYCERYDLMQFTGILDKNGVKIFEGDYIFVPYNLIGKQEVKYLEEKGRYNISNYALDMITLIGNIHDVK